MSKKQIEPTDAMVDEAANALAFEATGTALHLQSDLTKRIHLYRARVALRVALNHPDTAGRFADEDPRPWEPLNGPVRVGDEVRADYLGVTRIGVVASVDEGGDPWTVEGILIGDLDFGTWYVRRPVQELPTGFGAVIVAKEEGGCIEAAVLGIVWRAREAVFGADGRWHGVWRSTSGAISYAVPDQITPGTWKVEGE